MVLNENIGGSSMMGIMAPTLTMDEAVAGKVTGRLFFQLSENGKIIMDYEKANMIVNGASILIASLLKEDDEVGIKYLAIGTGGGQSWYQDPPVPTSTQKRLVNEIYRKPIVQKNYVDPKSGNYTPSPTNVVDYMVSFNEGDVTGALVEMGMFGGKSASQDANSGLMVNYRTFPVITKTSSMALNVIFRITT